MLARAGSPSRAAMVAMSGPTFMLRAYAHRGRSAMPEASSAIEASGGAFRLGRRAQNGDPPMTVTCCIRYVIDPYKKDDFEEYARQWLTIIPALGGDLL